VLRSIAVTRRAEREIRQAASWWVENRPAAPEAFRRDLERAFTLLSSQPEVGAQARNVRLAGVRRIFLHRVRYHLYYRVTPDAVEILAVWHASRGSAPGLSEP